MTPTEVAAYIGAAAWVPQIGSWLFRAFTRPKVLVVPDKTVQVGYTTYGPIFNLRLALSVARKDIVIDRIEARLRHTDGDEHILTWIGMQEFMSEICDASGNRQRVEKYEGAIALKLSTVSLVEKLIQFQDADFLDEHRRIYDDVQGAIAFRRDQGEGAAEAVRESRVFRSLVEFCRSSFWWKAGKYSVRFVLRSPQRHKLEEHEFFFELQQHDVDALKKNFSANDEALNQLLHVGETGYEAPQIEWVWRNPTLDRPTR